MLRLRTLPDLVSRDSGDEVLTVLLMPAGHKPLPTSVSNHFIYSVDLQLADNEFPEY